MDIKATLGTNFPATNLDSARITRELDGAKSLASKELRDKKQLDKASAGFEALLLQEMLKSMWQTVEVKGWTGEDSNEAKIYRDMMNQAISDSVSQGKGIGIKEIVKKELLKSQTSSKEDEGSREVQVALGLQSLKKLEPLTTGENGNENK